MSTRKLGIAVDRVSWHRNGVTGQGFMVAEFRARIGGRSKTRLLAVQLSCTDVAIINPAAPHQRFDGRQFNKIIQAAFTSADVSSAAYHREHGE